MLIETKKLKRVKNYAQEQGVTVQAIYKRIAHGMVKTVEIDGMAFIIEERK